MRRRHFMFEVEPASVAWLTSMLTCLFPRARSAAGTRTRRDVAVVLVLGRLERLRLDQDRALEADPVFVFNHHREEAGVLVELPREIGVEQ